MSSKNLPKLLNKAAIDHYLKLPIPQGKVLVSYVWVCAVNQERICCKTRTLNKVPTSLADVPIWTFSTYDDNHDVIESYLYPVKLFRDPFTLGDNQLVLCDVHLLDTKTNKKVPALNNHRPACLEASELSKSDEPWFGIEQEYVIMDIDGRPLGWPENGFPISDELNYVGGVGIDRNCGRQVSEAHYRACLYAGINIWGTFAEGMLSQWEYQIGPVSGIEAGDELIMSRYILNRVAEDFGVIITFDPKPIKGWCGSSCHTNFSTKSMREEGGMKFILEAIEKLRKNHENHLKVYDPKGGEDNKKRLGTHCAPSVEFSSGYLKNVNSVRIPRICIDENKGYLEDRRPSSNSDPYSVVNAILRTVVLNE